MGLFDEIKKLARPYDEDEDEDFVEEEPAVPQEAAVKRLNPFANYRSVAQQQQQQQAQTANQPPAGYPGRGARITQAASSPAGAKQSRREGKLVTLPNGSGLNPTEFVLAKPEIFENARGIADQLREKHPIVLNLERTPDNISRRLLDFLSGVAYAQDGKIKKIASKTYLIMPFNVDLTGEFAEETDNTGTYL